MKKIFFLFCLLFIVSCGNSTNVDEKLTNSWVTSTWETEVTVKEEVEEVKDFRELSIFDLSRELYSSEQAKNLKQKIQDLKAEWTNENKQKATYLESFLWDYKTALAEREALCAENDNPVYCAKSNLQVWTFLPEDEKWNLLENVKVTLDGKELSSLNYVPAENTFYHLLKYSKEWYLDFFQQINMWTQNFDILVSPVLVEAEFMKEVDSTTNLWEKTTNFTYVIPGGNYVTLDWESYTWKVKAYFFDLDQTENSSNAFSLNAFDENGSLVGDSMITFGMPYVKFYDENGNELKVKWWYTWLGFIQNQNKAPGIDLVNVPKNIFLGKAELDKYKIPPFWILTDSGVWVEGEMKILDEKWNYEFRYNN